ncbi:hypothetical protein quinque_008673 [Culex quinquefasciatus]
MNTRIVQGFQYFVSNCTIHGLRYLGNRCNVPSKLFWLSMITCSFATMIHILLYMENDETVQIHVDTSYLHWNNTFPAVSICYTKGRSLNSISKFLDDYWVKTNTTKPAKAGNYYRVAQSYLFVNPNSNVEVRGAICEGMNATCNLNLETMQSIFFPQNCSEIFMDVKFLGKPYNCDDFFERFDTEMGPCFVANSIYSKSADKSYEKLPMKYTTNCPTRTFEFRYKEIEAVSFMLYIHSSEELPYLLMPSVRLRKSGANMHYSLSTIEIFNYPDVKFEPIEKRECRFPFENISQHLPLENIYQTLEYSFTNCFLTKRIQIELEKCNCTLPTSPKEYKHKYCDFNGLICISKADILGLTKKVLFNGEQSCIQSCLEMEINLIGENTIKLQDGNDPGLVQLEVVNVPTSRYERIVAKDSLDFIVSLGGVGGLFFGISLLSLIEFMYLLLRKSV